MTNNGNLNGSGDNRTSIANEQAVSVEILSARLGKPLSQMYCYTDCMFAYEKGTYTQVFGKGKIAYNGRTLPITENKYNELIGSYTPMSKWCVRITSWNGLSLYEPFHGEKAIRAIDEFIPCPYSRVLRNKPLMYLALQDGLIYMEITEFMGFKAQKSRLIKIMDLNDLVREGFAWVI